MTCPRCEGPAHGLMDCGVRTVIAIDPGPGLDCELCGTAKATVLVAVLAVCAKCAGLCHHCGVVEAAGKDKIGTPLCAVCRDTCPRCGENCGGGCG